jgi:branched-subunit amino acid aminotransferase/4-amino-4-deoxychorismate lyase
MKHSTQQRAAIWGCDQVDDAFSLKMGNNGQLLVGECSTATLGGVWDYDGTPTVIVPHHETNNTLVGRTAWWVLRLAKEQLGMNAQYAQMTLTDLLCAQELWRTGNASFLASISGIGCLTNPTWAEPVIGPQLNSLLRSAMKGEIYPEYSTYVNVTT